jgi:hypothetical protein
MRVGFESQRKPECLGKQKRFQNMIGLSRIWRIRRTRWRPGGAKDECGTMKDEPKERMKPEEGARGRKEGASQLWNESRNVPENKRDASISSLY